MDIYDAQKHTLRYYRSISGLTQTELGRRTGMSHESIWGYENKHTIPLDRVEVFCEFFGITIVDWFYTVQMFKKMSKETKAAKQ